MRKAFLLSIIHLLSVSLSATLITVDPDAFDVGADISNAFAYVTLSSGGGIAGLDGKVYSAASSFSSTGTRVFANKKNGTLSKPWLNNDTNGYYLQADFTIPTNHVILDFISDNGPDYPNLWIYTTNGPLQCMHFPVLGSGQVYHYEIQRSTADILYIRSAPDAKYNTKRE